MKFFFGAVAGFALLLLLKYCIFGLRAWNGILHPARTESPTSKFLKPMLGFSWSAVKGYTNGKCTQCGM